MPGPLSKYISLVVSVIIHSIVLLFFYYASQHYNPEPNGFISLSFADEPEGGGGGSGLTATPEPEEKISTNEKKNEEKVKPEVKKTSEEKPVNAGTQESSHKGNGNGTPGTGNGTGTGTGTGKGGISLGIPIPKPPKEDVYLVAVDEMPEPIGGDEAIESRIIVPQQARQRGINGTVFVLAFIDEMGSVRKVLLTKGIGYGCDQAAMNAVSRTRFKPGKQDGNPVKVQVQIPVAIR